MFSISIRATQSSRSCFPVQNFPQTLRCHRQLRNCSRYADGIVDGGRNGGAGSIDATFARALHTERIERARRVFRNPDVDRRHLARRQLR